MIPLRIAALAALMFVLFNSQSEAYYYSKVTCYSDSRVIPCAILKAREEYQGYSSGRPSKNQNKRISNAPIEDGIRFLPHPQGCPRIAFCACGAAVEIFGRPIRELWPARAWYKFPRTSPGYKTVAVRNHHVFVLISHVEGDNWLVRDYNSGGHKSREHVVSIRGYKIVNPNGGLAMN